MLDLDYLQVLISLQFHHYVFSALKQQFTTSPSSLHSKTHKYASLHPIISNRSALLSSIEKFQSRHHGLNSILDGSSDSPPHLHNRIIRHPALREYYGRSFSSPKLVVHDAIQPCKSSQIHPDVESAEGKQAFPGGMPPRSPLVEVC